MTTELEHEGCFIWKVIWSRRSVCPCGKDASDFLDICSSNMFLWTSPAARWLHSLQRQKCNIHSSRWNVCVWGIGPLDLWIVLQEGEQEALWKGSAGCLLSVSVACGRTTRPSHARVWKQTAAAKSALRPSCLHFLFTAVTHVLSFSQVASAEPPQGNFCDPVGRGSIPLTSSPY